jgi:hypothetical protein
VIECPKLVDELKAAHRDSTALTIRTGELAKVDFVRAQIECAGRQYSFAPLGEVAQELIVKGGFEAVIRDQIASSS